MNASGAVVVVVKWSACLPSDPSLNPAISTVYSVKFVPEKNENKKKVAEVGPFFKKCDKNYSSKTFSTKD